MLQFEINSLLLGPHNKSYSHDLGFKPSNYNINIRATSANPCRHVSFDQSYNNNGLHFVLYMVDLRRFTYILFT